MVRVDSWLRCGLIIVVGVVAGCVTKGVATREACTNHLLDQVYSPAGDAKAVVFERRCGKPSGFSTQVSVLPADAHLSDKPGNVFVAGNGGRVSRGRSFVTVSWDGPKTLRVSFAHDATVLRGERAVGPVKVAYFRSNGDGVVVAPPPPSSPK
jgi:hypothetical protein